MDGWQGIVILQGIVFVPLTVIVLYSWGRAEQRKRKAVEAAFHITETERKRLAEKVFQLEMQLMRTSPTIVKGHVASGSIFPDPGSRGR